MTFDPAAATAGDLEKVRRDLEDTNQHLRGSWASLPEDRLIAVAYGLEALMRAASTLTLVVERIDEQQRTDRRRIGMITGRMNGFEIAS